MHKCKLRAELQQQSVPLRFLFKTMVLSEGGLYSTAHTNDLERLAFVRLNNSRSFLKDAAHAHAMTTCCSACCHACLCVF